ncbi:MAG: GspH/FimT family pseudopilin [Bacillota bacterium]
MRRISGTGIRPRPAPGRPHSARRGVGFTLVEILVVVAIVGIVTAVAAVNLFPSDAEVAKRDAGNVALAVEAARDAAWFGGRPIAITFENGRMRRWRLAAGPSWEPDPSADRSLDEARLVALYVDGQPVTVNPKLVFLADGFGVPFRVVLDVRGLRRAIEGDAAGSVSVVEG